MCKVCKSEKRRLWTFRTSPKLNILQNSFFGSLQQCPECKQLWIEYLHEPYASYKILTKWPYTVEDYEAHLKIDNGREIERVQSQILIEDWESLSPDEIKSIEEWRKRTGYTHNPIDANILARTTKVKIRRL